MNTVIVAKPTSVFSVAGIYKGPSIGLAWPLHCFAVYQIFGKPTL